MHRFFWILLILSLGNSVFAQPSDSVKTWRDSFPDISYRMLFGPRFCFFDDNVIESDSEYAALQSKCPEMEAAIDFNKETLIVRSEGGDCHVRFTHDFYLDTVRRKMVWIVYNYYGGCRAAGGRRFWCMVPRLPQGYTVEMKTYRMKGYDKEMGKD